MKIQLLAMLLLAMAGQAQACGELTVSAPWVRLAPPTAEVMAGYLTLSNDSEQSVLLQGASSDDFDRVEMHSMSMDGGVMQMRKLDTIEVKVGQQVELAPGGMHLMLIGPKRSFSAGERIEIALKLCDDEQQIVPFIVGDQAPEANIAH
jgi:periplasmic copper chaperone A